MEQKKETHFESSTNSEHLQVKPQFVMNFQSSFQLLLTKTFKVQCRTYSIHRCGVIVQRMNDVFDEYGTQSVDSRFIISFAVGNFLLFINWYEHVHTIIEPNDVYTWWINTLSVQRLNQSLISLLIASKCSAVQVTAICRRSSFEMLFSMAINVPRTNNYPTEAPEGNHKWG